MSRQLAAIMFIDIVGYTALMGESEQIALGVLDRYKKLAFPLVQTHAGKWLKDLGDGAICSFDSALKAVNAAIAIQKNANKELTAKIRIGIHLGDVTFKEGDIFGDGVNIAARIQGEAVPGGICLSEQVYKSISNQPGIEVRVLGIRRLKNVRGPVKLYQVVNSGVESSKGYSRRTVSLWWAITGALVFGLLASALSLWWFQWSGYTFLEKDVFRNSLPVERYHINLPDDKPLALIGAAHFGIGQTALAISPDGTTLVYVSQEEEPRLFERSLDSYELKALPGTQGAYSPFFSPDGKWVAFFSDGYLKKVAMAGGTPIILCEVSNPNGGVWTGENQIFFGDEEGSGLRWCNAEGTETHQFMVKASGGFFGEFNHPSTLDPDHLLISSTFGRGIYAISIKDSTRVKLLDTGYDPLYAPSGHLVFTQYGRLMAVPLDLDSLKVTGEVISVVEDLRTEHGAGQYTVSDNGTLVYVPGVSAMKSNLVLRSFDGKEEVLPIESNYFGQVKISSDGEMLVFVNLDNQDVYSYHLSSKTMNRLTRSGENMSVIWGPGLKDVSFSHRGRVKFLPASGAEAPNQILTKSHHAFPHQWSPDRKVLMFGESSSESGADILFHFVDQSQPDLRLTPNKDTETLASFSPDGNFVSYTSSESGDYEVYVQPFPPTGERWTVSSGGGEEPVWSPEGNKLYYRNGDSWIEVAVSTEDTFTVVNRTQLFSGPYINVPGFSYHITPDGQKLLLLKPVTQQRTATQIKIVKNWFEVLNRQASR